MLARLPFIVLCLLIITPTAIIWMQRNSKSIPYVLENTVTPIDSGLVSVPASYSPPSFRPGDKVDQSSQAHEVWLQEESDRVAPEPVIQEQTESSSKPSLEVAQVGFLSKEQSGEHDKQDERLQSHLAYGKTWGYDTRVARDHPRDFDRQRDLAVKRQLYLLSQLTAELAKPEEARTAWLMSFDADSVTTDQRVPLASYLPPRDFPDIHFLRIKGQNGQGCDTFFARVSEWSQRLLTKAVADGVFQSGKAEDRKAKKEDALDTLLHSTGYVERVLYLPAEWLYSGPGKQQQKEQQKEEANTTDKTDKDEVADSPSQDLKRDVNSRVPASPTAMIWTELEDFWGRIRKGRGTIAQANRILAAYYSDARTSTREREQKAMQELNAARDDLLEAMREKAFVPGTVETAIDTTMQKMDEASYAVR